MPGSKRPRPESPAAFTRVAPGGFEARHGAIASVNFFSSDPLASVPYEPRGFSIGTPTIGPMSGASNVSTTSGFVHAANTTANLRPQISTPLMYRCSPRSNPLFHSPMFDSRTPFLEYNAGPAVFPSTPSMMEANQNRPQSLLMSPMPFIDSPASFKPIDKMQRTMSASMDVVPGLNLNGPPTSSSVLERFKKFFEEQRADEGLNEVSETTPVKVEPDSRLQNHFQAQHTDAYPDIMSAQRNPNPGGEDDDEDFSSNDDDEMTSPEIAGLSRSEINDALLRSGSSCHQCKSRRTQEALSFCAGGGAKRKGCRKKYCGACLSKFYSMFSAKHKSNKDIIWCCPSCQGLCCCAACRRSKEKKLELAGTVDLKSSRVYSPATSMAVGLVYFGDFDLISGQPLSPSRSAALAQRSNGLQQWVRDL